MKFLRYGALLLILSFALAASGWGGSAETAYRQARKEYQNLLDSPGKQQYRDAWLPVIESCLKVAAAYPKSDEGAKAQYLAAKAAEGLYRVSRLAADARQAVQYYDQLAERFSSSTLADDGLYLAGELLEEPLADRSSAFERYDRLLRSHPRGDMAARAESKVRALAAFAPPKAPSAAQPAEKKKDAAAAAGREMTGVRFWSTPGYTRVVLDVDGPVKFATNLLAANPAQGAGPRLYVDLAGVVPGAGLAETTPVADGLLEKVRTGRPEPDKVRVVLDLISLQTYKIFALEDPFRIVIDISGERIPDLKNDTPELRTLPPKQDDVIAGVLDQDPPEPAPRVTLSTEKKGGVSPLRIVVDAGHGGKDPGAIGPSGTFEKDVTLVMAKTLARALEGDLGCQVILTRDRDVFIPLEERTAIANKVNADLFISLHANASTNREAFGIETYYLNFAKNDKAAAVVARENGTSLKQVGDLELILFDLMANAKINESSRLAAEIHRVLIDNLGRHYSDIRDLGVRQGPFYVLLGATMPSVLVETAFISHKREETRLFDRTYQERTVQAIVDGVRNYATALKMIASR